MDMAIVTISSNPKTSAMEYADENSKGKSVSGKELLHAGLLITRNIDVSVSKRGQAAQLSASGVITFPIPLIRILTGEKTASLHAESVISNLDGRKILLPYKAFFDGAEKLKDMWKKE